ncbi:MAG: hypothetical protein AB2693_34655, partial [Candidatus Thiodiazotropha sp.]
PPPPALVHKNVDPPAGQVLKLRPPIFLQPLSPQLINNDRSPSINGIKDIHMKPFHYSCIHFVKLNKTDNSWLKNYKGGITKIREYFRELS